MTIILRLILFVTFMFYAMVSQGQVEDLDPKVQDLLKKPATLKTVDEINDYLSTDFYDLKSYRSESHDRLLEKMNEILEPYLRQEITMLTSLPPRKESFIKMNEWYREFKSAFEFLVNKKYDIIDQFVKQYRDIRKEKLSVIEPALNNEISRASVSELFSIERTYKEVDASGGTFDGPDAAIKKRRSQIALQAQEKLRKSMQSSISSPLTFKGMKNAKIYEDYVYPQDYLMMGGVAGEAQVCAMFIAMLITCGDFSVVTNGSFTKIEYYHWDKSATIGYQWGRKTITSSIDYHQSSTVYIESSYLTAYFEACKKRNSNIAEFHRVSGQNLRMGDFVFTGLKGHLEEARILVSENRPDHPGIRLLIANLYNFMKGNWSTKIPGGYRFFEKEEESTISRDRHYFELPVHYYPDLPQPISGKSQKFYLNRHDEDSSSIHYVEISPIIRYTDFSSFKPSNAPREIKDSISNLEYSHKCFLLIVRYAVFDKSRNEWQMKQSVNWYSKGRLPSKEIQEYLKEHIGPPVDSYPGQIKEEIMRFPVGRPNLISR